jgi:hypothetical protein
MMASRPVSDVYDVPLECVPTSVVSTIVDAALAKHINSAKMRQTVSDQVVADLSTTKIAVGKIDRITTSVPIPNQVETVPSLFFNGHWVSFDSTLNPLFMGELVRAQSIGAVAYIWYQVTPKGNQILGMYVATPAT